MTRALFALILLIASVFVATGQQPCGENQEWSDCRTPCPKTCAHPQGGAGMCGAICSEGCQCKTGYIFKSRSVCVKPNQC